jgi:hypothetical protein
MLLLLHPVTGSVVRSTTGDACTMDTSLYALYNSAISDTIYYCYRVCMSIAKPHTTNREQAEGNVSVAFLRCHPR